MRILDENRATYKKTFSDKSECVFCLEEKSLECVGLGNVHWKVLVNSFPYMDGNVMIIPFRHIEKTEEISDQEWISFGEVLSKTKKILGEIFKTDSFNVGLNVGPESGASIPHLHWQIVPRRFKNITTLNTFADLYIVATTPAQTKKMIDDAINNS